MKSLGKQRDGHIETLTELVGIAASIEAEAVRRYVWLAAEMRRRGEFETAQAFDDMAAEEQRHIEAVDNWARGLGIAQPDLTAFAWRLPQDLAADWDEAARSSLLTPYRAYAIAVDNEQRAFAFYTYLAASADDPAIAREAETLAREELRHAAILRVKRRLAWRMEGQDGEAPPRSRDIQSTSDLAALVSWHQSRIAVCHQELAERLRHLGATADAELLARSVAPPGAEDAPCDEESCQAEDAVGLLFASLKPLETLSQSLEEILLSVPDDEARAEAEDILDGTVARIAEIGRRIEFRDHG